MKKSPYFVCLLLTIQLTLLCAAVLLIRSLLPAAVLPRFSIPFLTLLALIPLVIRQYLVSEPLRVPPPAIPLAGIAFTLLPLCAGWDTRPSVWLLFPVSCTVFGIVSLLYSAISRRMSSAPRSRLSPIVHGLGLYLASQCLQGLL